MLASLTRVISLLSPYLTPVLAPLGKRGPDHNVDELIDGASDKRNRSYGHLDPVPDMVLEPGLGETCNPSIWLMRCSFSDRFNRVQGPLSSQQNAGPVSSGSI